MRWVKTTVCAFSAISLMIACGDDDSPATLADAGDAAADDDITGDDDNADDDAADDDADDDVTGDDDADDDDADDDADAGDDDADDDVASDDDSDAGDDDADDDVTGDDDVAGDDDLDAGAGDAGDAGPTEPPEPVATVHSILSGSFAQLTSAASAEGVAQLVRYLDGTTEAALTVTGLDAAATYTSHVHNLPCAISDGGSHYKFDPSEPDTLEANEIWLNFETDAEGNALSSNTVNHMARGDAMSVVVHASGGARVLCADLAPEPMETPIVFEGTFAPFADAPTMDQTIGGTATLEQAAGIGSLTLTGLDEPSQYVAHVHALPCEVDKGGGHYKLDPTSDDATGANEIWFTISSIVGSGNAYSAQAVRADAQSIVLHRYTGSGDAGAASIKVACANLARTWPALVAEGDSTRFAAGNTLAPDLEASATLTRDLFGKTRGVLAVSGAIAGSTYPTHLHALPCDVLSGGAHYKLDPAVTSTVAANEVWLNFTADTDGDAEVSVVVDHLARPEGRSLVVHGGPDNDRLACIDLTL